MWIKHYRERKRELVAWKMDLKEPQDVAERS